MLNSNEIQHEHAQLCKKMDLQNIPKEDLEHPLLAPQDDSEGSKRYNFLSLPSLQSFNGLWT